ncbi:MAG: GNAT family N-acetyltransferase [Ignavibacteria bacterium]
MVITYKANYKIEPHLLAELFKNSGIRRPLEDLNRIKKMIDNANILITAWDGEKLVGAARGLTDFGYCCYLSDLAVDKEYHNNGIGHDLVNKVQEIIGSECMLLLLSSPESMDYYPKIGFEKADNAWIIHRKR